MKIPYARALHQVISIYPIHTEIFAPKSNEINFIPVRDCWLLVGRFLSLVKNIVRPITGHGRLFVTSEENRRALSVFSQRLASNGESNKMASRFKDLDVSVEDFISEQENESTKKKTLQNVAVLQQFLASKKFFITIFLRSILLKSQYV